MLKKTNKLRITGIIMLILSVLFSTYLVLSNGIGFKKELDGPTFQLGMFSLAVFFLGLSFVWMNAEQTVRNHVKSIFLDLALIMIAVGVFLKLNHFAGRGPLFIMGAFLYCFSYAPLQVKHNYYKWLDHSNNKALTLFLTSMDFVAINFILLGFVFKMQHWHGASAVAIAALVFVFIALLVWNWRFRIEVVQRKASQEQIAIQNKELEKERDRSENLLLNILPHEIAEELKENGEAKAQSFENVSILFSDFKDFTRKSSDMEASELVEVINVYFRAFDQIIDKYGIEKIKTIGDSYMAVGGAPNYDSGVHKRTIRAALEMQDFVSNLNKNQQKANRVNFEMRIGIHTGPVVAGIVGLKKFQYDIWGDTVNTASRLESSGEVGRVNISHQTHHFIKEDPEFSFESRGKIEVKGKGEIEMYFVRRT